MILETERTLLRPFAEEDAADVFAYARDPRVGPIAGWKPHESVEESREIIRTVFSSPNAFAVADRETGRVIGSAGFVRHGKAWDGEKSQAIGYALSPAYWGRGIMTEAVKRVCGEGAQRWEDMVRIYAEPFAHNTASRRVLEKAGFTLEGVLRQSVFKGNAVCDSCMYALLAEDI